MLMEMEDQQASLGSPNQAAPCAASRCQGYPPGKPPSSRKNTAYSVSRLPDMLNPCVGGTRAAGRGAVVSHAAAEDSRLQPHEVRAIRTCCLTRIPEAPCMQKSRKLTVVPWLSVSVP